MNIRHSKKAKGGFSIIELVIVIAVIAILAAILIPTFSNIIGKAQFSKDLNVVTNMNKLLIVDSSVISQSPDYDTVKSVLANGGYQIPYKTSRAENSLYWIPAENLVVIYDTEGHAAIYPKNYIGIEKDIDWVLISEEHISPTSESTAQPEPQTEPTTETPAEPQDSTPEDTTAKQPEQTTTPEEKKDEQSDVISEIIDWIRRLFGL